MSQRAQSAPPIANRLQQFATRLLLWRGAEVDWPTGAEQGLALLPEEVARTLRCLEVLPLAPDGDSPLPINLTSDFLDRVEPLVGAEPPVVLLRVPEAYLKRADMAEPVARTFNWVNARVHVHAAEPTRTEYHTWYFLATLDSADRWQQVVRVTVNAASDAEVALPDPWDAGATLLKPRNATAEAPATHLAAARAALRHVERESGAFIERQEGRLGRDRQRLQDYYRALLRGDGRRSGRRGPAPDPAQRESRSKAVQLELRRKLAELDERYACRLDLHPLALARTDCPALAIHCRVLRRSAARIITLFWNALTKELEPLSCQRCGVSTFTLAFSDDKVVALCTGCHR